MTEDRPYRKGMSKKAVIDEMENHMGNPFRPYDSR